MNIHNDQLISALRNMIQWLQLSLLFALAYPVAAQNWCPPGIVYQFESTAWNNPREVITLRVSYDGYGNASINRTTRYAGSQDNLSICSFGPPEEISISTIQNEPGTTTFTFDSVGHYYLISFDSYTHMPLQDKEVTITAACTANAKASCEVSTLKDQAGVFTMSAPGIGCSNCSLQFSNAAYKCSGGVLILKANSVVLH
jgi:hypothetical protein